MTTEIYSETGYRSEIKVGEKYLDLRYEDTYEVINIDMYEYYADVTISYKRKGVKIEKASFLLYHIDKGQHRKW